MKKLVGLINNDSWKVIKTRWMYIDTETSEVKEVTKELFDAIEKYNDETTNIKIPYKYKNGLTEYSFGCGLSHYLQQENFEEISKINELSFQLEECIISMFTKSDIKNILKCTGVFDLNIKESLIENV